MNIKEIALRVAEQMNYEFIDIESDYSELLPKFAEALVAEIRRQSEPTYQFRPECENWIDCTPVFYESWRGEKRTVFTFPPDIEALEDKVAKDVWEAMTEGAVYEDIVSGEWKKFRKGG